MDIQDPGKIGGSEQIPISIVNKASKFMLAFPLATKEA